MRLTVQSSKSKEAKIIEGIIKNDSKTFNYIYNEHFGKIKSMVYSFQYINLEPDDVFQEGLTRAVINIRKGLFQGNSTFSTYLYGICRNICLKEYNKSKLFISNEIGDIKDDVEDDYFDLINLMLKLKDQLDENCIKIIDLRFGIYNSESNTEGITRFDKIAAKLNISADNARQRFGRCFAKLKKLVTGNPMFHQLMD